MDGSSEYRSDLNQKSGDAANQSLPLLLLFLLNVMYAPYTR
jgi:hypothetical protein